MRRKLICILLVVMTAMGLLAGCGTSNDSGTASNENAVIESDKKVLVVYYSATGHTKNFADAIAEETGADTFEILPVEEYSQDDLDYNNDDSRVCIEYNNEDQRDIELTSTTVENWDSYDIVFVGYPIWWGIAAWPIDNFIKTNDFTGKVVIPFCTAYSSGMGESGELLEKMAGTGEWQEGIRFQQDESTDSVKTWLAKLTY